MDRVITADSVVRSGACVSGVYKALRRLHGKVAAAMPVTALRRLVTADEWVHVTRAAELDGYGYGYGSGGYGYGYGGYGDGYGYGSGGYGYGSGDGYGGSGCGDGVGGGD